MDFLETSHYFTFSRGGRDDNNWNKLHFISFFTNGYNEGDKKEFHKFLERTCQSANFLREIIKNSWLGVCLSQLQTELLCSYQTEMITFILPYFHLQRTEKHWIPFQTLFGPSFLIFTCTLFFLFRTITKMRSMLKSWLFGSPITCTNLPVLQCGVNQD